MAATFGNAIAAIIDRLVRWVIVPITGVIRVLVRTGMLFLLFAALWAAFLLAIVLDPAALGAAWATIAGLPLPLQALAWLVFLPLMGGLWVWQTDWPLVVRLVVVAGIAGWNLLVFLPRREASMPAAVAPEA